MTRADRHRYRGRCRRDALLVALGPVAILRNPQVLPAGA
jgi:hypothetical protein